MAEHADSPLSNIENISQDVFDTLANRLILLRDVINNEDRTRAHVEAVAEAEGVHPATIYRNIARLEGNGTVRDLLPNARGFPKGRSRLDVKQEELIWRYLRSQFLTQTRPSMAKMAQKIGDACEQAGLSRPSRATIIRRLQTLPKRTVVLKREGAKAAEQQTPRPGRYAVSQPWDVWQIDHTLADVIVVDEGGRPIGRVWLTVVIDVCTRMVVAFYIGLEPASSIRVATTLDLAVSSKTSWLAARGLDYSWPCEGLPSLIHSDRAKEFVSRILRNALLNYGVGWFLRPPGRTRYGGHVERLIGTLMGGCRLLPGATYHSPKARGDYDSKSSARLRIDELEMYFAHQILGAYHNTEHSALGMTPLQAWMEKTAGRAPIYPDDMETFRFDLFPEIERTVTRQGIKAFCDEYYCQEIGEYYISGMRRAAVKYDPRDLSRLYVKGAQGAYIAVPYRLRRERPPPTLWLLKAARRSMTQAGSTGRDQVTVRRATESVEQIIKQAATKSDKAARQVERLRRDRSAATGYRPSVAATPAPDDDWGGAFRGGES